MPAGKPITGFANNDFWRDDVGDGPVTAEVTFPGQAAKAVERPAWVVSAPPDFAPELKGIVTMYDIAFQAAVTRGFVTLSNAISFSNDVLPILLRATRLRWVNQFDLWNAVSRDWRRLSDKNAAGGLDRRRGIFSLLTTKPLNQMELTAIQKAALARWRDNDFTDDFSPSAVTPPAAPLTAAGLDRAALEACVGGGFFPGIEAPSIMTNPALYAEAFRLSHAGLQPGSITELMALPWQADFKKCAGAWWPSQRPDDVFLTAAAANPGGHGMEESKITSIW